MVLGACSGLVHRVQASHLHRVRRGKNKQTLEEEEGEPENGSLDKSPVDKVEDNRRWSTRRAERAPSTPFSWAACE